MRITRLQLSLLLLLGPLVHAAAQTPADAGNWNRLKALPAHTKVHVAGDKQSKVCMIDVVDDATLQCSKGGSQYSFTRDEVKSVKVARYKRSTLVGLGIGLGVGGGVGAIVGHTMEKPDDWFPGLATGVGAAVIGTGGLLIGAGVGAGTDFMRGPTVYRRP